MKEKKYKIMKTDNKKSVVNEPEILYSKKNIFPYILKTKSVVNKKHELSLILPDAIPEGKYIVEIKISSEEKNKKNLFDFAGSLTKKEGKEMIEIIAKEFNKIEIGSHKL